MPQPIDLSDGPRGGVRKLVMKKMERNFLTTGNMFRYTISTVYR